MKQRHFIYIFMLLALGIPLAFNFSMPPARMPAAESFFKTIDNLQIKDGQIAFVALDFGPSSKAENEVQAVLLLEQLMRKRIPFALFSSYFQSEPFLNSLPEQVAKKLEKEYSGETWKYGHDWINLGYRPGAGMLIQAIPKSKDLSDLFKKDARGNNLQHLPLFSKVKTIEDIALLAEVTCLVGVFDTYIQFFQTAAYKPPFLHGATSITVPSVFIYMDSGQISGLLEGVAGAAWYSHIMKERYPNREGDTALVVNTSLGIAHLVIIFLIILGNAAAFAGRRCGHANC